MVYTYTGTFGSIVWTAGTAAGNLTSGPKYTLSTVINVGVVSTALDSTRFIAFYDTSLSSPDVTSSLNIVVGTYNGSIGAAAAISFGTPTTLTGSGSTPNPAGWHNWPARQAFQQASCDLLTSDTTVFVYNLTVQTTNPNLGTNAFIVTTSTNTISVVGTSTPIATSGNRDLNCRFLTGTTFGIGFSNITASPNEGNLVLCSYSRTTITAGNVFTVGAGIQHTTIASAGAGTLVFNSVNQNNIGASYVITYSGLVPSLINIKGLRPLGIATTSGTAGQTISVTFFGIVSGFSNLIPGTIYIGNADGTITQSAYQVADYYGASVPLGVAVTSSTLLLRWAG